MPFTVSPTDFLGSYYIGQKMPSGMVNFVCGIQAAYCLSNTAAANLAAAYADLKPTVVRVPPLGPGWGGIYGQYDMGNPDNTVPWLQFTGASGNPVLLNAGVVANTYNRGYSQEWADSWTRQQLEQAIANG